MQSSFMKKQREWKIMKHYFICSICIFYVVSLWKENNCKTAGSKENMGTVLIEAFVSYQWEYCIYM
jgi:hypothetical protein